MISFVQELSANTDNSSTQTFTITPGANATAGNQVVLCLWFEDDWTAGTGVVVTDSRGNTWTKLADSGFTINFGGVQVWGSPQDAGPLRTTDTVTVDHGITFIRPTNYSLQEWSGITVAPLDQTAVNVANTANPQAIAAGGATSVASTVAVVFCAAIGSTTALTLDAALTPIGAADVVSASGGLGATRSRAGYQILTATGTPSYSNSRTGGSRMTPTLVIFRDAGATTPASVPPPIVAGASQACQRASRW